ncbi:hypothetical protein ABZZ04_23910 [Streptomyces sp. NPDC006435]|uniref:hypothetical protein n=1 Tax=Streptomyces sp. NPDC006435 TaxID=3154300 RepID=UPI0033A10973
MGDDDTALEHQLLDLAERQREAVVQPHAVGNDLDRVPVSLYDGGALSMDVPPRMTSQKIVPPRQSM